MARILETEVMSDQASVDAYDSMAGSTGTGLAPVFIRFLESVYTNTETFSVADLGCGPCGYHQQLYTTYPNARITAYEASTPMLDKAATHINPSKTTLVNSFLPDPSLPAQSFDLVISSLFLHQLPDASVLWNAIKQLGKPGSTFAVFDFIRVEDSNTCWNLVNGMTPGAPEVFCTDFYNSLRASFIQSEIEQQLVDAGLTASITVQEIYPNCSIFYVVGTL